MISKIVQHIIIFAKKIVDDDVYALASQLAYNLILAFFPFLMFVMTLIGFSNLNSEEVLSLLRKVVPLPAYQLIQGTVTEIITTQQTNLLWISIGLAIWTSSSGFSAVIRGLNKAYGVQEDRSFIKTKLIAIFSVFVLAIIIIITLFLFVFSNYISAFIKHYFENPEIILDIWIISKNIFMVILLMLSFAIMYELIPCRRLGWLNVLPGAAFATLGWIAASYGFAYYVNNFSNYSRFYGGLGAVFIFMTWIFLTSFILILGGEVNAILVEK